MDFRNRRKVQRPKSADQEQRSCGISANPSGGTYYLYVLKVSTFYNMSLNTLCVIEFSYFFRGDNYFHGKIRKRMNLCSKILFASEKNEFML